MVTAAAAKRTHAHAWWSTFSGSIPELQNVADLSLTVEYFCDCKEVWL